MNTPYEVQDLGNSGEHHGWRVPHDAQNSEEHPALDVFVWADEDMIYITQGGSIIHDEVDTVLMPVDQAMAMLGPLIKAIINAT